MTLELTDLVPLIQVYDMPDAIRFYCDAIGFTIVSASKEIDAPEGRHFQWARLRLGQAELMLNTAYDAGERPPQRDTTRDGVHQDTTLFFGCPDVDGAFEFLKDKGWSPDPPIVAPYGMKQLFLKDPDGYALCLQAPAQSKSHP